MQMQDEKKGADIEELKDCFRVYDEDDDNFIDFAEFADALRTSGASPAVEEWEIQHLFAEVDRNGDARIDIEGEFELFP